PPFRARAVATREDQYCTSQNDHRPDCGLVLRVTRSDTRSTLIYHASPLRDPFNDSYVPIRAVAERLTCGLIIRRVMRGGCLSDGLELNHDNALVHPSLVGLRGHAAHK